MQQLGLHTFGPRFFTHILSLRPKAWEISWIDKESRKRQTCKKLHATCDGYTRFSPPPRCQLVAKQRAGCRPSLHSMEILRSSYLIWQGSLDFSHDGMSNNMILTPFTMQIISICSLRGKHQTRFPTSSAHFCREVCS